jgi:mannose-1-phosphate guanylyltransferase
VQALILAGGEGTRLRPLTSTIPKAVVPLVGRPLISYMLEWLRGHGVDEAILSCGFMADGVRRVLGDGSALGVKLQYIEEPRPLGTGGALRLAQDLLHDRFLMLNGDMLTDLDLTAQLAEHERTGARVTLGLIGVEDPSAYGLVRRDGQGGVTEFVEKPSPDEIDSNLISVGAYVIEREVLDSLPSAGTKFSIEREVFPELVGDGLYGHESVGYWLDLGTPERYLQATFDILGGDVKTAIGRRLAQSGGTLYEGGGDAVAGTVHPPALIGLDCHVPAGATIGGRTVLGTGVRLEAGAHIDGSVLLDGCRVGAGARVSAAILGPGVMIGDHCRIDRGVVLGENVKVGAGNVLTAGMRIFPGVELPEGAVSF